MVCVRTQSGWTVFHYFPGLSLPRGISDKLSMPCASSDFGSQGRDEIPAHGQVLRASLST